MTCRVVRMTASHLAAVHRIERVSYSRPWSLAGLRHELEASPVSLCRVALAGEGAPRVAGYVFAWDFGDEVRVNNLAVDPRLRRLGVGRALLARVIEEARLAGRRRLGLEVRAGNEAARALYASLGFRQVGRRPGHYEPEGEDALVFELCLDP